MVLKEMPSPRERAGRPSFCEPSDALPDRKGALAAKSRILAQSIGSRKFYTLPSAPVGQNGLIV
jgi:hypothetical protein